MLAYRNSCVQKEVFVQAVRLPRNTVNIETFEIILSPGSLQTLEVFAASEVRAYENVNNRLSCSLSNDKYQGPME